VKQTRSRAFTLLEVLIAVGVLFIIGSAIVSLSNTLIKGTVGTAESTVANLWAVEGLELTTKYRDDRVKEPGSQTWIAAAQDHRDYGWYYVSLDPLTNSVELERAVFDGNPNNLHISKEVAFADTDPRSQLQSEGFVARRFVCIESLGVPSINTADNSGLLRCNLDRTSDQAYSDGSRLLGPSCDALDLYCTMTEESLARNTLLTPRIPAGNAVKVRSVIVWPTQFGFRTSEMATTLTNWKGLDQ
jgi:type II secretory pathway pseudopilin PulG